MLEYCWSNLRNQFQWNLKRTSYIFIQENAFKNVVFEMAAMLSRLQYVMLIDVCHEWELSKYELSVFSSFMCFVKTFIEY